MAFTFFDLAVSRSGFVSFSRSDHDVYSSRPCCDCNAGNVSFFLPNRLRTGRKKPENFKNHIPQLSSLALPNDRTCRTCSIFFSTDNHFESLVGPRLLEPLSGTEWPGNNQIFLYLLRHNDTFYCVTLSERHLGYADLDLSFFSIENSQP